MPLSRTDIDRVAHLARLALTDAQAEQVQSQLNQFFSLVQTMSAVDTQGVEPLSHPLVVVQDLVLRLREDQVSEGDQRAANQRSAPAVQEGLFLVPKVIE